MRTNRLLLFVALTAVAATIGCQHVNPWDREHLADEIMRADRDPLGTGQDEHVFFSREAATGGRGVGGGGCGCN